MTDPPTQTERLTRWCGILVVLAAVYVLSANWLIGVDFWWHIRTGEDIVRHGTVPRHDPFSFTVAGARWIDQSWLAQVAFYYVDRWWGFAGLVAVRALLLTLAVGLAARAASRRRVPFAVWGFVVLAVGIQLQKRSLVRPFLFSFVLWCLFFLILDRVVASLERPGDAKAHRTLPACIALVPLTWLWANCHAAFPLGLALIGAFGLRLAISLATERPTGGLRGLWALPRGRGRAMLVVVFAASLLMTLVNPNGADLWRYFYELQFRNALIGTISEWRATPRALHTLPFWLTALTWVPLAAISLALRPFIRRRGGTVLPLSLCLFDLILAVAWTLMGARAVRHLGYAMLLAIPVYSTHLWQIIQLRAPVNRGFRRAAVHVALIAAGAGCIVWKIGFAGDFGFRASPDTQPLKAIRFIESFGAPPRVFAHYGWGGLIIRYFYPRSRVFIDTRSTLYREDIGREYDRIMAGAEGWQALLATWHVGMLFLDHKGGTRRLDHFAKSPAWVCVYWDDQAVVFVPPDALLGRPGVATWPLSEPAAFGMMMRDRARLAAELPRVRAELERKVRDDPDCMLARHELGTCLLMTRQFGAATHQWEVVVRKRPGHFLAWYNLGTCFYEVGSLDRALECRRHAYRLDRHNPRYSLGVAQVLMRMGRFREAVPWLERALRLDPRMVEAKERLAFCRQQLAGR